MRAWSLSTHNLQRWARQRAPLLGALLLTTLLARWPEPTQPLDALLHAEGYGPPLELRWLEPPAPGAWRRALLRVAPTADDEARSELPDVVLAELLLDSQQRPMRLRSVGNLTRTPDADDQLLAVNERWAAVGHRAAAGWVGMTLLDLHGDPGAAADPQGEPRPLGDRLRIGLNHLQSDGAWRGVGRDHYTLDRPIPRMSAAIHDRELSLLLEDRAVPIRLEGGALLIDDADAALVHEREPWILGKWSTWGANFARAIPAIGPDRVARAERIALDLTEHLRHNYWALVGHEEEALINELAAASPAAPPPAFSPPEGGILLGEPAPWPPPPITPLQTPGLSAVEGEGAWKPWVPAWGAPPDTEGPWPIVRTAIRVDPRRSYDPVVLVAMDMRQLNLHVLAGTNNPHSTTGYRGTGTIPRDPHTLQHLVLAFNGGFKTSHGAYGMMLQRRTFIPPKPATATLAIDDDGNIRMGTWPGQAPTGNYNREREFAAQAAREGDAPPPPPEITSFRQNLPPLVERGQLNPTGAVRWGGSVDYLSSANTPRSGVCVRAPNTLMFVWGGAASATDLGRAMLMAGCDYGMHLDMNPFHTGIAMYHVPMNGDQLPPAHNKTGFLGARYETPAQGMTFDWFRYLRTDLKDFFYVTRATTLRQRLGTLPEDFSPWSSHGLPTRQGGLHPLALITRRGDLHVLAFAPDTFNAQLLTDVQPGQGTAEAPGDLQLALLPRDPNTPAPRWRRGPQPARPVLTLSPLGFRILPDGADLPADQPSLPGTWLLRDRAWTSPAPHTPSSTLIAATLITQEIVLISSPSQHPDDLRRLLERLPVEHAIDLGPASLLALASDNQRRWVASIPSTTASISQTLLLQPAPERPPVGALRFPDPPAPP